MEGAEGLRVWRCGDVEGVEGVEVWRVWRVFECSGEGCEGVRV